jgi:hypothetical protein
MVDPVKELFQVQVHHPSAAFSNVLLCLGYGLVRRASGPKPMTMFGKLRLPFALQHLHDRLLHHPVQHRRDAQLSHPSVRLGYLYPLHRLRPVGSTQQLFADRWPMLLQVAGQLTDAHPVDARAALVGPHSLQSLQTVVPLSDLFHQLLPVTCRAFGHAFRRECFGPFPAKPWSFTPPFVVEGQL